MVIKSPVDVSLAVDGGTPVRGSENPLPRVFPRYVPDSAYDNVREVLDGGVASNFLSRFEDAFAEATGTKYCVSIANCTAALHSLYAGLGVGPGDEVAVSPITDFGTIAGIIAQGAIPIFPDVDVRTGNVTAETIEKVLSPRTAAIVAVHFYGLLCPMEEIVALGKSRNITVAEDVCQAPLANYSGQNVKGKAGSLGDVGGFSFDAEKHLTADHGGAVTTDDKDIADKVRSFALTRGAVTYPNYGRKHESFGLNYRFGQFQAGLALAELEVLEEQNERRRQGAAHLSSLIDEIDGLTSPYIPPGSDHIYWLYHVRLDLDQFSCSIWDFAKALAAEGLTPGAGPAPYYLVPDSHTFMQDKAHVAGRSGWPWDHPMNEFAKDIEYSAAMCPQGKEHLDTTIRWTWTDKHSAEDIEDMATMFAKVGDFYRV